MVNASSNEIIIFVVATLVALSISGIIVQEVTTISNAFEDSSEGLSQEIRDDIKIVNNPKNIPTRNAGDALVFYVKNTGSSVLPADTNIYQVFIDGEIKTINSVSIIQGNNQRLLQGDVAEIEVSAPNIGSGDHTVKIISRHGKDKLKIRL